MLKPDGQRPNTMRGAASLGGLAGAVCLLSAIAPLVAMADSPSLDPTATPPSYQRSDAAANLQCQGAIKIAGGLAQAGPYAEMQARHNAIENWRTQVSNSFGSDFTQWWRARDKDVSCQASAGSVQCQALAVPCMARGGSATMSGLGMNGAGTNGLGMGGANPPSQPAGVGLAERKR